MMGEGDGRGTAEGSSEPKLEGKGDNTQCYAL